MNRVADRSGLLAAAVAVGVLFVALAVAADDAEPRLSRDGEVWTLRSLPPILGDEGVRSHLETGLTTTLALRVVARGAGGRHEGGALVTVRYQLWDEIFEVSVVEPAGPPRRLRLESFDELERWWTDLRVRPFAGEPPSLASARLEVDVVPFSAAEERETRRWLSDSLDAARRSATESLSPSAEESDDTLGRTFRLMMATSIRRRAVQEYRFDLVLRPDEGERP